ncbi:MAG: hypothetical protein SRB1_02002 [Desulfobacteraceae bacterium Eth-SRB1]|nr:MAG: hypothetical protein SRB1_02002 [Desulfobacteraceae bacterium Eth-SRB1]
MFFWARYLFPEICYLYEKMKRDFILKQYKILVKMFQQQGYFFVTFKNYMLGAPDGLHSMRHPLVILRHDVDRKPENALVIAKIEKEVGIRASYYFRIVKESYDEDVIRQIVEMGHEIGYHYENLSLCRGNYELSIMNFELDLEKFRKLYPVKTICMHGSPLSKWDNRDLWKRYDYRDYGIIAEPYFDLDFDEVFYLTDTGRRWDGDSVSVRDKVGGQRRKQGDASFLPGMNRMGFLAGTDGRKKKEFKDLRFRYTWEIIEAAERGVLPDKVMINTHPQRWTDNSLEWMKELVWQNIKNLAKKFIVSRKGAKALRRT